MKRVQLPRSLMELSTDAEPTFEHIARHIEVGQIDKFDRVPWAVGLPKTVKCHQMRSRSDRVLS